jgi:hypothetical protein
MAFLRTLLCAALLAAPAAAQPVAASALVGRWALVTAPHPNDRCVISGEARGARTTRADTLRFELTVKSECPDWGVWHVRETCTGVVTGAHVAVACTLISAEPDNYVADNFTLDIASPDRMNGRLYDHRWWDEPCVWRRQRGPLVS